MGEWINTPHGKRYKEDYGHFAAYFLTEPDENGKRKLPSEVTEMILEVQIRKQTDFRDQKLYEKKSRK